MHATVSRFSIVIPAEFIELPTSTANAEELTEHDVNHVRSNLHALFGGAVEYDDDSLAMTTAAFCMIGLVAAAGNAQLAAIGLLRSSDADRPVVIRVVAQQTETGQSSPEAALSQLLRAHRASTSSVQEVSLTAGRAVKVTRDVPETLEQNDARVTIINRESTVWLPDPTGQTVVAVSISSANLEDWSDIDLLATEIFSSLEWDDSQEGSSES